MHNINYLQYRTNLFNLALWVFLFFNGIHNYSFPNKLFNFLDEEFSESLPVLFILFFSALCTSMSVIRSSHITFEGLGNYLLYSQIIALLINLLLNFSLIPIYGIKGAAISTLVSQIFGLILSNLFFKELKMFIKIQIQSLNVINLFKLLK